MKIGFGTQLWLRDNHFENFCRMLDEMSLVGLDGFEMCFPFLIDNYGRRVGELRKLLEMHDLELASYYTGVTFYDPELRERGVAEVKRRCRFCADLGTMHVLLDGGRKRPGITAQELDDQIQVIAETANVLGEYAASCGLTLSWHQHWGSIFDVQAPFHRLMELTDPQWVKFCPDVGQLALSDFDVVGTIQHYADRVGFVHYKDVTFDGRPRGELWPGGPVVPSDDGAYGIDSRGRWVELGRGVVDFPAVTKVLRSAGYDGWIVDDFDFTGYRPRDSAQACKDYINHGLGVWGERDIRRGLAP
jgi:inosose dehydratase